MAFERLLTSFRTKRIVAHSPELLVVDKPVHLVVHGGDVELAADLVTRLKTWLRDQGEDDYLGVHQRLDTETSGVMLFTRRPSANPAIAQASAEHALRKVYVAVVELQSREADRLRPGATHVLSHQLATDRGLTRVVRHGGKAARASLRLLERSGSLALCELELLSGRTHQLRVQLEAFGAPILGDPVYGRTRDSDNAPRLMLHARWLALPDGRRFESPLPPVFERVLSGKGRELGDVSECSEALADAGCLRAPLMARADVFRLANDAADGLPGVTIDRYGGHAVLNVASVAAEAMADALAEQLVELGAQGVYLKRRAKTDLRRADHSELAPPAPVRGMPAPERFLVDENGMNLWVELGGGLSTGLFVDQRDGRARVRALTGGGSVLNLFAYTCSFSVAAALAGARRVTSVDLSGRVLEWGRQNFEANGLDPEAHQFVQADAVEWLRAAGARRERYDLVILDPPSFSSEGGGKAFSARNDYGRVAELALKLTAAKGRLLAVTNHRGTSVGRLRKLLREAAERAGRDVQSLKDLPSPLDCPPLPEGPHPSKSVLVTLGD